MVIRAGEELQADAIKVIRHYSPWPSGRVQIIYAEIAGVPRRLMLPAPNVFVLPGIAWGHFTHLFTPAFWRGQAWHHQHVGTYSSHRFGRSLIEETAACLLGGYGMKAELGLAAYARLRDRGLLRRALSQEQLEAALSEPFLLHGRSHRYRFPRQKAGYLAACLERLSHFVEPTDDVVLREHLTSLPGIGLKTASWIVRNYRASDAVAIIDVHVLRAGRLIGFFTSTDDPSKQYRHLERRFLEFAAAIGTPASRLDALLWDYMRRLSPMLGRESLLGVPNGKKPWPHSPLIW